MTLPRETLVECLRAAFEPLPSVHAMWLGGSDAFGANDRYSDIDAMLVVDDDAVESVFEVTVRALTALSPIENVLRIPEPTWHGLSQAFYRLRDAGEYLLVDLTVAKRGAKTPRFNEREIHGEARVLFDKSGEARPTPFDAARHAEKLRARRQYLAERHFLARMLPKKEVLRGRPLDALGMYGSMLLAPLVELLRMRHCPVRFDFGMRYLERDLPEDLVARLVHLAYPRDLEDLGRCCEEATRWIDEELATTG